MSHGHDDIDRTLEAILDAATRAFTELGSGASMADVAREAGVGRATLYRHASSREELLEELQRRALGRLSERFAAAGLDTGSAVDGLARLVNVLVGHSDEYRFLVDETIRVDEAELTATVGEPILAVVERCRADGVLRDDLPLEWQARQLGATCVAAIQHAATDPGADARALTLDAFLDGHRRRT